MSRTSTALLAFGLLVLVGCGASRTPAANPTASTASTPTVTPGHTISPSPSTSPSTSPSISPSISPSASPTSSADGYVTRVPLPPHCLVVSPEIVGVKVYLVQRALGLVGHRERYDAATQEAVRRFQARHGLPVDGVVGRRTWAALPIAEPFCVDQYTAQPRVGLGVSARQRIEAMIGYARARLGTPYIWGGAGPMGFDCSGLAIQAMYAGGRVVPGLNTNMHVQADFTTTDYLYASSVPHARFSDRRRGDLIFYGTPITHMAIYLGGGRIIEAVRPVTRESSLYADGLPARALVLRPFPGGY